MLRAIFNSALALLIAATLFWGGCISCPQFFMFPSAEQTKKSCCNKAGKCERPAGNTTQEKECKRMPLEPQEVASHDGALAAAVVTTDILPVAPILRGPVLAVQLDTEPAEHSPPDLTVLNSTFLI